MSLQTVPTWMRHVNWGLYFAAYGAIALVTWDLVAWRYFIVIGCVAIVQGSAWWRGKYEES